MADAFTQLLVTFSCAMCILGHTSGPDLSLRQEINVGKTTQNSEVRDDKTPNPVSTLSPEAVSESFLCTYEWDRHLQSPEDFVGNYCSYGCKSLPNPCPQKNESISHNIDVCTSLECFICKFPQDCVESGMCQSKPVAYWADEFTGLVGCLKESIIAVMKCPDRWMGSESLRQSCEADSQSITVPVTDPVTKVTYKNKHCALCHNATSSKEWTFNLTCDNFQSIYTAVSEEEAIEKGRQSDSNCTVSYVPPEGIESSKCQASWFSSVIKACNVTGLWESFDTVVEENCLRQNSLIHRVQQQNRTYQNLFCAICNGAKPAIIPCSGDIRPMSSSPLSLLFGLKVRNVEPDLPESKCENGGAAVFSAQGMCRNLSCTPGKILDRTNNTCKTALTQIRGLVYNFTILLEPRTPVYREKTDTELYESLTAAIQFAFDTNNLVEELTIDLHRGNCSVSVTSEVTLLSLIIVSGSLRATTSLTRDEVESMLVVNLLMEDSWLLLERDGLRIKKLQEADVQITSETLIFSMSLFKTSEVQRQHIPANKRIALTPMLICAYIVFIKPEFEIRTYQNDTFDPQIILVDGEFEAELQDVRRAIVQNNTLLVCYESVQNLTRRRRFQDGDEGDWHLYLLSMVVFGLSLLCLVLTLLVYLLLPALRTQPGLNVMGTCVALLVAQVTLLLSFLGIASGMWCTALGIFLHFVWLSTFCWNFISSWHMYRAFSAKTFHNNRNIVYRKLAENVAITIIISSIIVALVIGTSHYVSGGVSIGYSKDGICYLDTPLLVGVSVVLPVSIIVVTNAVLFGLTVYRINQVRKLQTDLHTENERESRQYIYACVRLSFLTGFTWVLTLLAEGLDLKWMKYISVIANGGQGVLIFLSYVTTWRILRLLTNRLDLNNRYWTSEPNLSFKKSFKSMSISASHISNE